MCMLTGKGHANMKTNDLTGSCNTTTLRDARRLPCLPTAPWTPASIPHTAGLIGLSKTLTIQTSSYTLVFLHRLLLIVVAAIIIWTSIQLHSSSLSTFVQVRIRRSLVVSCFTRQRTRRTIRLMAKAMPQTSRISWGISLAVQPALAPLPHRPPQQAQPLRQLRQLLLQPLRLQQPRAQAQPQ